jgi:hypothetical protein
VRTAQDEHLRAVLALVARANQPGARPVVFTFRYTEPGVVRSIEIAAPVDGSGEYDDR